MSGRLRLGLAALVASALGCAELPDIPESTCGNGAVDAREDCDGRSRLGTPCRPPGSPGECRLDCTPSEDGAPAPCPAGWGCDADRVCRRATGGFRPLEGAVEGNAAKLMSGDFDGDGRDDVVAMEAPGVLGFTKLRVHWFDAAAAPIASWPSPKSLASAVVTELSGDGLADIAFSTGQVGALLGEPRHALIPETYPSYHLPAASLFVGISEQDIAEAPPILILTSPEGTPGLYRLDAPTGVLLNVADLAGSSVALGAAPVSGNLFEDEDRYPCLDVVLAYRGNSSISIYSVCERDPDTGVIGWRERAEVTEIELDPPAGLEGHLSLADIEGDGHLDILMSAGDTFYVASGDGQGFGAARPYELAIDGAPPVSVTPPLAAGDVTGDGAADFVYPRFLLLSERAGEAEIAYRSGQGSFRAPWTEALIADLNGNGWNDVAAASNATLDIDFLNGTGSERMNAFVVPTTRPVEHLSIGDFDGDLIDDLAFAQTAATFPGEDEVSIAFGNAFGAVGPVVPMAHVENVEQLLTLRNNLESRTASLFVTYDEMSPDGSRSSALAILAGSGDRSLVAAVELTSFAEDGGVRGVPGLAVAVGDFLVRGQRDVVSLSVSETLTNDDLALWVLPDFSSRRSVPLSLGYPFDVEIAPVRFAGIVPFTAVRLGAGDVDADDLDEVVFVAPDTGSDCVLGVADLVAAPAPAVAAARAVRLGAPCSPGAEIAIQDVDADGAPDVLLLDGPSDAARSFLVYWNDGAGRFDAGDVTRVDTGAEDAQSFTTLHAVDGGLAVAYVTRSEARLIRLAEGERSFGPAETLTNLSDGTGITAADVDGDRIVDLAVADAGSVRVLRAVLAQ